MTTKMAKSFCGITALIGFILYLFMCFGGCTPAHGDTLEVAFVPGVTNEEYQYGIYAPELGIILGDVTHNTVERYLNVTVPKYSTIYSAVIFFSYAVGNANALDLRITAEYVDSANILPTTYANWLLMAANMTTAHIDWSNIPEWTSYTQYVYQSPDFHSVVQEVVDRSGWKPGNAINVIFSPINGTTGYRTPDGAHIKLRLVYHSGAIPPTTLMSCAIDNIIGRSDTAYFVWQTANTSETNDYIRVRISTSGYTDSASYTMQIAYVNNKKDSTKIGTLGTGTFTTYASSWVWDNINYYSSRCQSTRTFVYVIPPVTTFNGPVIVGVRKK